MYDFLVQNKISLKSPENKIVWQTSNPVLNEIIRLLFDFRKQVISTNEIIYDPRFELKTIPFSYKIAHNEKDFRELTIIHPKNQLAIIDFYEKYKQIILYYNNQSPFSIRRANKVARFTFHRDNTHKKLSKGDSSDNIEQQDSEYESLKTFFVYEDYSNIHKFYESYKYHRCEKKYNKLYKFDISKCFDSIYTHSLCWALISKKSVKDNLKQSKNSFSGFFDALMQNLNYGETNGIVIGPEFSRIFAEMILQQIDKDVESELRKNSLKHKVDYEIFRYVDDYFIFFNDEGTRDSIERTFRLKLKEYKLYLNESKIISYEKPIITNITIAKQKIVDLLNKSLKYNNEHNQEEAESPEVASIYVSSNRLVTKFKTIIKVADVSYKDILNYTFSVIEKKIIKIIKNYQSIHVENQSDKQFIHALNEILDFVFFLYLVSPKVNTTIKLCRILRVIIDFFKSNRFPNKDYKHLIYKNIYDNIYMTMSKNKVIDHTQVETLYLLIALSELGSDYKLDADILRQYFCIDKDFNGKLSYAGDLNYFTITVLLFYIGNKKRYLSLKNFICSHITERFKSTNQNGIRSELVLLLFDIISCPYLDITYKRSILALNGVSNPTLQDQIINYRKYWFTKWDNFNFGEELDAKHSQEVY